MKIPLFRLKGRKKVDPEATLAEVLDPMFTLYFPTKRTVELFVRQNKTDWEFEPWEKVLIDSKRLLCAMLSSATPRSQLRDFLDVCVQDGVLKQ